MSSIATCLELLWKRLRVLRGRYLTKMANTVLRRGVRFFIVVIVILCSATAAAAAVSVATSSVVTGNLAQCSFFSPGTSDDG